MISMLSEQAPRMKNLFSIVQKQLKIFGFIMSTLSHKYENEFYERVPGMVAAGKIKYKEDVTEGLEGAGEALLNVLMGENKGAGIVIVGEESR